MADIPGIINGAHIGKGLGIQFLKHIQRTKVLLFLIDINSDTPFEDYQILKKELHLYDPLLDKKPHLVALSKIDLIPEEDKKDMLEMLKNEFRKKMHERILPISSVTGENLNELNRFLFQAVKNFEQETE